MIIKNTNQRGAVSLFIVVFSALLITIVTIGFVGIMVKDQQQASTTDLSQSAYDSAQSGVEDAKRAILRYQSICASGGDCVAAAKEIDSSDPNSTLKCNQAITKTLAGVVMANNEVKVQTQAGNSNESALDQAYTCVKINLNTDDYVGVLAQDASKVIPLVSTKPFNRIKIEWFSIKDIAGNTTTVDVPLFGAGVPLLGQSSWTSAAAPNRPSIMRAQLIQFAASGFSLSDFDDTGSNIKASNNTLFLYPTTIGASDKYFNADARKTAKNIPQISCSTSLAVEIYSCSATIVLPQAVVATNDHVEYLNLTSLYKKSNYRVTLIDSAGALVQFNAVQPSIDSTGRTNNLFRRVQSRVELVDSNFPYPEAELDLTGSLCKNFIITDKVSDYTAANSITNGGKTINGCTP